MTIFRFFQFPLFLNSSILILKSLRSQCILEFLRHFFKPKFNFFSVGNGTSITWWNNRGPCNAKFRPQPLWHSKQRIWWTGCTKQTTWRSLWDNDQNTDEVLYSVYISKIPLIFEINRKIEEKNHDYFLLFWVGRFFRKNFFMIFFSW